MALNKWDSKAWSALVEQAALEIRQFNPHIGAAIQLSSDEEYADLSEDARKLAVVWDDIDRQCQKEGKTQSYTAAEAVDEDRGE